MDQLKILIVGNFSPTKAKDKEIKLKRVRTYNSLLTLNNNNYKPEIIILRNSIPRKSSKSKVNTLEECLNVIGNKWIDSIIVIVNKHEVRIGYWPMIKRINSSFKLNTSKNLLAKVLETIPLKILTLGWREEAINLHNKLPVSIRKKSLRLIKKFIEN